MMNNRCPKRCINVSIVQNKVIDVLIDQQILTVEVQSPIVKVGTAKKYDGEYTVTPVAFEEVVLETKNTILDNDIRVLEIPYFRMSNISGDTVYIGQTDIN